MENVLNKQFASVCNWFVDKKLSIQFGENKSKCILFNRRKDEVNITYIRWWNNKMILHSRIT